MLPTPDTSHVPFSHIYEPAEDSYLLLDTLSTPAEAVFLTSRFPNDASSSSPLVVEIGSGSGVVVSFIHAHAQTLFGSRDVLSAAVDLNPHASLATAETARVAQRENKSTHGEWLGAFTGDLALPWRPGVVDVLVFNPPYVPTDEMPVVENSEDNNENEAGGSKTPRKSGLSYEEEEYLISLSWAGGRDGMEVTSRLIDMLPETLSGRGCAYILLCARNRPEDVKERIRKLGREGEWMVETVGESGAKAGWERLCIIRAWRDST